MDNSGMSIRPASDADKEAIFALSPRLAGGVAPWRDQDEARAAGRRWLADSLAAAAAGDGTVLVAADGDAIAGVISVRPSRHFTGERDAYIGELAVAERAARRGVGSALVEAAEGWAREQGLVNLTLLTGAFNTGARAFYAALGFAEEEVRLTRAVPTGALPRRVDLAKQLFVRKSGFLQQQLDRVLGVQRGERPAQADHGGVLVGAHQQVLAAGAGRHRVNGGEDPLLGQVAAQPQLHVAGALELLEQHVVELR
ncbi:MAG: N-acetyltransferase family protein, partial [Trebonia sp.]